MMNPSDPYQQQQQQHLHEQRPQHPLANYQFSSEELRVFRECNTESFFQRSMPFGTTLGIGAYLAVKQGYLSPNIKYGAVPKVILGVVLGYFVGKFSYQQKCAEKIMALPNSKMGEILRQRKNQAGFSSYKPDINMLSPFAANPSEVYSDEHMAPGARGNALNLDMEARPTFAGLDDTYRPNLDNSTTTHVDADIPLQPVNPGTTYDELRRRNRDEYAKKQQSPYSQPLQPDAPVVVRQPERPMQRQEKTNKYGDSWTD